jgi:hypothetical protein
MRKTLLLSGITEGVGRLNAEGLKSLLGAIAEGVGRQVFNSLECLLGSIAEGIGRLFLRGKAIATETCCRNKHHSKEKQYGYGHSHAKICAKVLINPHNSKQINIFFVLQRYY